MSVAVAIALVLAGVSWALAGDDGPSGSSGGGEPGRSATYLRLDGGRAGTVAVSASDQVEVWWREPGAARWSAPQVVDGGPGRYLIDTSSRLAGSTLAIRAMYSTKAPWDDEAGEPGVATSTFIVCGAGSCAVSDHYEKGEEPPCRRGSCVASRPQSKGVTHVPELDANGHQVFFGATGRGYVVWDLDHGLREVEPDRCPRMCPARRCWPLTAPFVW